MFTADGKYDRFEKKVWLATPTRHGMDELQYIIDAFDANWLTTAGENVNEAERMIAERLGVKYACALASGTSALHLSAKLAGEALHGVSEPGKGALCGKYVACSDMTFDATVNPMVYEGAVPVFIDTEYDTWNMDPVALEEAFKIYPDIKLVVLAHLYGCPAKIDDIKAVCKLHGALLIEDAAESLGSTYKGKETGTFGDYSAISLNGNKIITGSSGGMFLTDSREDYEKVKKLSTQARESAAWYQHEELGYNYRMSNLIAGMVRGQIPHLEEHIAQKKVIYESYRDAFAEANLPVSMNPFDAEKSVPNYWLSGMIIHPDAMCKQVRSECEALYIPEHGKSCPTEILEALASINAEGRPVWKPMHAQPIYRMNPFVTREGNGRAKTNAYIAGGTLGKDGRPLDVGMDIFHRALNLPSDNKMTEEQQRKIIDVIIDCFN